MCACMYVCSCVCVHSYGYGDLFKLERPLARGYFTRHPGVVEWVCLYTGGEWVCLYTVVD